MPTHVSAPLVGAYVVLRPGAEQGVRLRRPAPGQQFPPVNAMHAAMMTIAIPDLGAEARPSCSTHQQPTSREHSDAPHGQQDEGLPRSADDVHPGSVGPGN